MTPTVLLETKCWEGDWLKILTSDHLPRLIAGNPYPFADRWLMINNVSDYPAACRLADQAVEKGWLTQYFIVKDHADDALRHFGLTRESLGAGYVYSISELVSLYLCRTDFLLHFASDCLPIQPTDWVGKALTLLESDPRVKVATLSWDASMKAPRRERVGETPDFYLGYGFSDQCYLVRTADFRAPIFKEFNLASNRYPVHGGELFEKRVDSWMRNHRVLRATTKNGAYKHDFLPMPLGRKINNFVRRMLRLGRHAIQPPY